MPNFGVWNPERVETDTFFVGSELGVYCLSAAFRTIGCGITVLEKFWGHLRLFICDYAFDEEQFIDFEIALLLWECGQRPNRLQSVR